MPTVLITGVTGFIGRHLASRLHARGWEVIGVARSNATAPPGVRVLPVDLASGQSLPVPERAPDAVIHLAQSRRHREFPAGSADMFAVNVAATHSLLEWARVHGVRRFFHASTGNVYRPQTRPLREDDPVHAGSMYAASKLAAEHLVQAYGAVFSTTVLRIFGVYGPGQQGMLIPGIADRVRQGQAVTLAGGVGLHLTPLYVEDCCEFVLRLIDSDVSSGDCFNLAGAEHLSLRQIAETCGELLRVQPVLQVTDSAPTWLLGDNARICQATGHQPRVGIAEGLYRTLIGPPGSADAPGIH